MQTCFASSSVTSLLCALYNLTLETIRQGAGPVCSHFSPRCPTQILWHVEIPKTSTEAMKQVCSLLCVSSSRSQNVVSPQQAGTCRSWPSLLRDLQNSRAEVQVSALWSADVQLGVLQKS